jgi:hypothetical protein
MPNESSPANASASAALSGRRNARRPNEPMKERKHASSSAPDGVQPTTSVRSVGSATTASAMSPARISAPLMSASDAVCVV